MSDNTFPSEAAPSSMTAVERANQLKEAAAERAQALREQAATKAEELKKTTSVKGEELKEVAVQKAQQLKEVATEKTAQLRETASVQFDTTKVKAKEIQGQVEDYINENPTKSALIALGTGFVLGLLMRK